MAMVLFAASSCAAPQQSAMTMTEAPSMTTAHVPCEPTPRDAPREDGSSQLARELETLRARVDGQVSFAIVNVETGYETSVDGDVPVALYSTFKAWVGVAVADAVERGEMSWTDTLRVAPEDLVFAYQPIAEEVGDGRDFTLQELVRWSVGLSDNPSVDALMAHLGGVEAVSARLGRMALRDIAIRTTEAGLQAQAEAFRNEATSMSEEAVRRRFRERLSATNESTALGVARALSRLVKGELLGAAGTARILRELRATQTGRRRLSAGLSEGWSIAHKTGTAHTIAGLGGVADIGILTAPDHRRYAVAGYTAVSSAPREVQEDVIADVARALVHSVGCRKLTP